MLLTGHDRFAATCAAHGLAALTRRPLRTLQVNMGKLCNQACRHCHVDAGPQRTEMMSAETVAQLLDLVRDAPGIRSVDITGGAPELNPHFRSLVDGVHRLGHEITVRCNLTVLQEPGQADLPEYYASRGVALVSSLPCYTRENVDQQRGGGVFDRSIDALHRLNAVGYGAAEGSDEPADALRLDLAYNPLGPELPPPQAALEADYRERLSADFGLRFDHLLAFTNLPIHRFADDLQRQGRLAAYEDLLQTSFNPAATEAVMCRELLSVDWDGQLADCDYHQMLDVPLGAGPRHLSELRAADLASWEGKPISTATHCLGCTAGQGSSCSGALALPSDG